MAESQLTPSEVEGGDGDLDHELEDNPDGSVTVTFGEEDSNEPASFDANLAEHLDETELDRISQDLREKIDRDKKARERRDQQYEEGLKKSGLSGEAPGGAQFEGASRATHPMLAEATVDFAAACLKEIYPPDGPVRIQIIGETTEDKLQLAARQRDGLNWQMTKWVPEYISELEQVITQLPMGGSQYQKFWVDNKRRRWTCEFVPVDKLLLPFACADFYSSPRVTHVQDLTEAVVERRIKDGQYRDIINTDSSGIIDVTKSQAASDKIEGRDRQDPDVDGERLVYEVKCDYEISIDGEENELPYLISIDERTGKILSIYRNWDPQDELKEALDWIVEWKFLPWRGAYGIGWPHLIAGLSTAATGALRALLDSAHANNAPGGLMLKGFGITGQTTNPDIGQYAEVDAPIGVDDIRKAAMPFPLNPTSPVLLQLLAWLTDAAKGVVTTAEEKIKDAGNQMPVGTALALIEQGAKVFSSIFARLHRSQEKAINIIARLCVDLGKDLDDAQMKKLGFIISPSADYAKPCAVQPVSDPNIFSEGQRYAQFQMALGMAGQGAASMPPVPYNLTALHRHGLKLARIPNIDEILPEPPKPTPQNAVAENMALLLGQNSVAFPDQDHLSHIYQHIAVAVNPMMQVVESMTPQYIINLCEHLKQHLVMFYAVLMHQHGSTAAGQPLEKMLQNQDAPGNKQSAPDPEAARGVDKILAHSTKEVLLSFNARMKSLWPTIEQLFKQAEAAKKAGMVPHPDMVTASAVMADAARQAHKDAGELDLKRKEQENQKNNDAAKLAMENKAVEDQAELGWAKLEEQAREHGLDATVAVQQHLTETQETARQHGVDVEEQARQHEVDTEEAARQHDVQQALNPLPMPDEGGEGEV